MTDPKVTAYCMKCRKKREIKDPRAITHSNGKDAITGTCSKCGTKVFRMGKIEGLAPAKTEKPRKGEKAKAKKEKKAKDPKPPPADDDDGDDEDEDEATSKRTVIVDDDDEDDEDDD